MPFYTKKDRIRLSEKDSLRMEAKDTLYRDGFHDDVARLVHSPSYRRLVRKRQLLPSDNSDFVRNRLTHSNEVAQIATCIGTHLNKSLDEQFKSGELKAKHRINADLLVFAGLAHDIGHPPFGHLGEVALNRKMLDSGGFEGNAQTLRVLTKLEKRLTSHDSLGGGDRYNGNAGQFGLNLTFRTIASILKYNVPIAINGFDKLRLDRIQQRENAEKLRETYESTKKELESLDRREDNEKYEELLRKLDKLSEWQLEGEHPEPRVEKGFYLEDKGIVERVHHHVFGEYKTDEEGIQSIECQIMDFADDVAYSIYDLEDCLKTGTVTPQKLLSLKSGQMEEIADEIAAKLFKSHKRKKVADTIGLNVTAEQFSELVNASLLSEYVYEMLGILFEDVPSKIQLDQGDIYRAFGQVLRSAEDLASDGRIRRKLTEAHISRCCASVEIDVDPECPAASSVSYPLETHIRIEFLKRLNFHLVINSDLIQADEFRGEEIVSAVFDSLYLPCDEFKVQSSELTGYHLLPADVRVLLDDIFEQTASEILEVRHTLAKSDSFLDDVVRKHPRMRVFSLKRMLGFRDYEFRYSLAISLYEEFLRHGDQYRELHDTLRKRRVSIKRLVCDFIAGMTDRGLAEFYGRIKFEDKRVVLDEFGV